MVGSAGSTAGSTDIFTNLSHLLPTGQFLAFQAIVPLFTNNGDCQRPERILTAMLLGLFFIGCFGMSFVDSVTTDTGKVYYGVVTPWGLYNAAFKKAKIVGDLFDGDSFFTGGEHRDEYSLKFTDFMNGILNVITFGVLSCLSPPVTTCYYPGVSQTIVKCGPVLAAIIVGALFALFPSPRHGVGFAHTDSGVGIVQEKRSPSQSSANGDDSGDHTTLLMSETRTTVLDVQATHTHPAKDPAAKTTTDKTTDNADKAQATEV